jgi:glutathione S-transferase
VRLVLTEKDLSYEKIFVDLIKNEQKAPDFLRLNPYGKVPVLVDEDEVIYDSTIINEYLDDEYPHPPLLPEDSGARARVRTLEDFADNSFTAQGGLLTAELRKPPEQVDQDRVQRYRADLGRVLEFLERHLEGKEYMSGAFSLADLAFVPRLLQLPKLGVEISSRLINVLAWSERVKRRPAVKQLQQELGLA